MEYKISKLTLIKWYRINYKRLCTEVNKLNKQIEKLEDEKFDEEKAMETLINYCKYRECKNCKFVINEIMCGVRDPSTWKGITKHD